MMYSIRTMAKFSFLFVVILSCCGKEERDINCGYKNIYKTGAHFLTIPNQISPNKEVYSIGDTITVSYIVSDSIYDTNLDTTFLIEGFPFLPQTLLYKFDGSGEWESGFNDVNEVIVDEKYEYNYGGGGEFPVGIYSKMLYESGTYSFEFEMVCNSPGRYVMLTADQYNDNVGTGNFAANDFANSIDFEGKCFWNHYICNIIEGEDHFDDYIEELMIIDENNRDNYISVIEERQEFFGLGGIPFEFCGIFGFEVVE